MRSWCLAFGFLLAASVLFFQGCGAVFINEGSKNASLTEGLSNPAANPPKKVAVPREARVVNDFESGGKATNSKLFGGGGGMWLAITFGGNTLNADLGAAGGANGTPKAAHIYGNLTDHGDKVYPDFEIQGKFKDSGFYDASNFTGIQFYYKCPATDQALKRRFKVGTAVTLPPDQGGTCSSGCYDNFGADLSVSPDWTKKAYAFTDLKREGWGAPVTPPDMSDHLKEFINLTWAHSANNAAGTYAIDYWVDEVEFY
ncbi:MAG TPA: hypothetical protein VHE12_00795 [bacterium]|nr:hypothetical protein [bacterium]